MGILFILDLLAEFIFLSYQAGQVARKVIVPALVFTYVAGERAWAVVNPIEKFYNEHPPFTLEVC